MDRVAVAYLAEAAAAGRTSLKHEALDVVIIIEANHVGIEQMAD